MSIQVKVRQGGASASQPDLASLGDREGIPIFASDGQPLIDFAQRWEMGQAGQGSYTYVDVPGEATYFHRAHAEIKLIEDASGNDYIIGWGRMEGGNDTGRRTPTGIPGHGEVEHSSIQVMDCNIDLRGLPFRTEWERPAETTWQRLQALELRSLNGSSSTGHARRATTDITINNFGGGNHLVDASSPVDMDAKTYPVGTTVLEVMEDIFTQWEGKRWGVTIHHQSGASHKCLLVLDPGDNTTFTSNLKISDHLADYDPDHATAPVLEPVWARGAGKVSDNQDVISGLISVYGGTPENPRHLYVETGDPEDEWETWVDVYNDDKAANETQATRRANRILNDRKRPYVSPQPSIRLNATQVHLITAGQSIQVKSVVVNQGPDKNDYVWWRIAEIRWEPIPNGQWWAHLTLDRARNARGGGGGGGGGHAQPGSTSPKPPPICTPDPGPTTLVDWDWEPCAAVSYTDPFTSLTGNPWNTYPGWTTSPGCSTSARRAASAHFTIAPDDVVSVQITCARYGGAGGAPDPANLRLVVKDVTGNTIQNSNRTIQMGGLSHEGGDHGEYVTTTIEFDPITDSQPFGQPAGYAQLWQTEWSTFYVQHVVATTSAAPPENDEFCVPEGSSDPDDPYFSPSTHNHDDDYAPLEHTHTPPDLFISWKAPVRVATTANGTLASAFDDGSTVDGVTLEAGDRILIKDQTDASENGIYLVQASGAPTRDYDMDDSGDFVAGAVVRVNEGTANADKTFGVVTDEPITLDTDDIDWEEMAGGGGGGHDITEDGGSAFTSRTNLDFRHGLDVTDSSGTDSTRIAVDEAELDHALIGGTSPDIPKSIGDAKGDLVGFSADNTPAKIGVGSEGQVLVQRSAATPGVGYEYQYSSLQVILGDGTNTIASGFKTYLRIPYACTIVRASLMADVSGLIKVDIWKDTWANFPPTDADTITGGNEPEITPSGTKDEDTTLTSWTTSLSEGDVLGFNVDSASTVKRVTLELRLRKA